MLKFLNEYRISNAQYLIIIYFYSIQFAQMYQRNSAIYQISNFGNKWNNRHCRDIRQFKFNHRTFNLIFKTRKLILRILKFLNFLKNRISH